MTPPLGLIAGAGRFPFHIVHEAKRQGVAVAAVGIRGWADPGLAAEVDAYHELPIGRLGQLIKWFKAQGVRQAVMAGKVTKEVLLDSKTDFDLDALAVLAKVKDFSVPAVLGAIGARLAGEGVVLLDSSAFLKSSLCPEGTLTAQAPTPSQQDDIRLGFEAARQLAALDIGQTVVVKGRVIVAVEALEGTDAAIRRAHELAGAGLVVVKTAAPDQDRRFDLPIIGQETLTVMAACGVACLAVEAGATLLLDRDALVRSADAAGLCLVGMAPPAR